jgi:hypothetical protein
MVYYNRHLFVGGSDGSSYIIYLLGPYSYDNLTGIGIQQVIQIYECTYKPSGGVAGDMNWDYVNNNLQTYSNTMRNVDPLTGVVNYSIFLNNSFVGSTVGNDNCIYLRLSDGIFKYYPLTNKTIQVGIITDATNDFSEWISEL